MGSEPSFLPNTELCIRAFSFQKYIERDDRGKGYSSPVVGIVARLSEEKRHVDLINAMKVMVNSFPTAKLMIVGDGPLASELRCQVAELDLDNHVVFSGYKVNVFEELNKMDIFVLASRSEGFPISIFEAMASGLPVVATKVGGIPEVVIDGQTGILVSPFKPGEIVSALTYLFEHSAEADHMGVKGRKRVMDLFGHDRFVKRHEELYWELFLNKKHSA